jgi:hypothetical protein
VSDPDEHLSGGSRSRPVVIAIIPAFRAADRIAATVAATAAIPAVTRVLVVDDASDDGTARAALDSGAEVLVLPSNVGKGGAVAAGVAASPDADIFLLVDADLQETASETARLLPRLLSDDADLAIAVLPDAAGRGGFGFVRDLAARGIRRASGFVTSAPLSGQRAVRAELLRDLVDARRFGLEVAMTVDVVRAGGRVVEIEAPIEHAHTGRSWRGFVHRGRQGVDVVRALWPRLTSERQRLGAIVVCAALLFGLVVWSGSRWEPTTVPLGANPESVVVFGLGPYDFDDLGSGHAPTLARIRHEGAVGAMTVRTVARRPSLAEGYLSLGAGARVRVAAGAGLALPIDYEVDGVSAGELLSRATGSLPAGEIAVLGAPASVRANRGVEVASPPGALGATLADAGIATAVIGVHDRPASALAGGTLDRPAALAVMSDELSVDTGSIDPDELLVADPSGPFGVWSDPDAIVSATERALDTAGVVVVDPGDLQRVAAFRSSAMPGLSDRMRDVALARTDRLLAQLLDRIGDDTLVLVVSVAPRGGAFRLTPVYAVGPGVPAESWITSASTKRTGLSTLTDLAPTIIEALGVEVPAQFPGTALRYERGPVDTELLLRYDRETNIRERTYYPQAQWFIIVQAILYAMIALTVSRNRQTGTTGAVLRWAVLAVASYPVSTFVIKALPWATTGSVAVPALLAVALSAAIATLASRRRGHVLAGFDVVLLLTVSVIVFDMATGARLNISSWLGYSLHSAGRFYGLPNSTFAVLGSATIILAATWVARAGRRREALAAAGALFAVVALANGLPFLGGNVGSILTFVPVFALTWWALSGRRVRIGTLVVAGLAGLAALVVIAGIDLARPAAERAHLGRFAAQVLDEGIGPVIDTYLRKQSANFRIFRVSIWTWMIPVVAAFVLYLLVWGRGWERLLPPRSALRIGVVAVVGAALLGFAANDSGPIVIALFFVYLLPFLALLALDPARDRRVVLLAPPPASVAASTPPAEGERS